MHKLYNLLVAISNFLFRIEKAVLLIAVAVVVTVNFMNVCLRYLANYSLNFCEMLSVVLFMFMVLIGANIAVKSDTEIKIEIFRFKDLAKDARFKLIGDIIAIVCIAVCLYGLYRTIGAVTRRKQLLTPLPIYTYHVYYTMTVGFALIIFDRIIVALRHLIEALGGNTANDREVQQS